MGGTSVLMAVILGGDGGDGGADGGPDGGDVGC